MSSNVLTESNALFQYEQDTREICEPLKDSIDLTYFSYGKFYDDGRCVLLSTNKNVFINHFEKKYKLTLSPENDNGSINKIYNLILIDDKLPEIIADEYCLFGHGVMLDLIKKYDGYYEMFCFVSNKNSKDPINKFLNSRDKLDIFSAHFLKEMKPAIVAGENKIIHLPDSMKPLINGTEHGKKDFYSLTYRDKSFDLTRKQVVCLSLLSTGKTTKEIASLMGISHKTVEDHIRGIKIKLNCLKKSDLCTVGIQNNLTEIAFNLMQQSYEEKN